MIDRPVNLTASITKVFSEISRNKTSKRQKRQQTQTNKQTEKQENRIKKHNNMNNKYANLHTITSELFSLRNFTQKILSGYRSDDICKKDLHPLPLWHYN